MQKSLVPVLNQSIDLFPEIQVVLALAEKAPLQRLLQDFFKHISIAISRSSSGILSRGPQDIRTIQKPSWIMKDSMQLRTALTWLDSAKYGLHKANRDLASFKELETSSVCVCLERRKELA